VLSTGEVIANPKHLELVLRTLRRLERQAARRTGPDRRSGQRPSRRWRKTRARIERLYALAANARRDGLHQLTTRLASTYGTIVLEDLHVSGMLRNRRLARRIADVGMGELRRLVDYKTTRYGGRLVVADRWYPSSKTCSSCGVVKTKLRLSERIFTCEHCGLALDRDLNAARNLAALAAEATDGTSTASCVGTLNQPEGNPRKTSAALATGTAPGRPAPTGAGQRRRRKATAT
jgi:putative transposase